MKRSGKSHRPRHVPERTCVACRARRDKRLLIRVGWRSDAGVVVDASGKGPGRGAYLCRRRACWRDAKVGARLGRALKVTFTAEDLARLAVFADTMPEDGVDEQASD